MASARSSQLSRQRRRKRAHTRFEGAWRRRSRSMVLSQLPHARARLIRVRSPVFSKYFSRCFVAIVPVSKVNTARSSDPAATALHCGPNPRTNDARQGSSAPYPHQLHISSPPTRDPPCRRMARSNDALVSLADAWFDPNDVSLLVHRAFRNARAARPTGCLTIGGKVVFGFGSDVPENLESSRPWSVY